MSHTLGVSFLKNIFFYLILFYSFIQIHQRLYTIFLFTTNIYKKNLSTRALNFIQLKTSAGEPYNDLFLLKDKYF